MPWFSQNSSETMGWVYDLSNLYYGGQSLDDGEPNLIVFDTFYPGIGMPVVEWTQLITLWHNLSYIECNLTTYRCGFEGPCSEHITEFYYLAFNLIWDRAYEVSPLHYLIDTRN
jgi:hypothetical protein